MNDERLMNGLLAENRGRQVDETGSQIQIKQKKQI